MNTIDENVVHFIVIFCYFVHFSTGDLNIAVEQFNTWRPISADDDIKHVTGDDGVENVTTQVNMSEKTTLLEFVTYKRQGTAKPTFSKKYGSSMKRDMKFSKEKTNKPINNNSLRKKSNHINIDKINVARDKKVLALKNKYKSDFDKTGIKVKVTAKDISNKKDVERETYTSKKIVVQDGRNENNSRHFDTEDDKYDLYYLSPLQISNQLRYISDKFPAENLTIEQEILGKTHQHKDIIMLKVTEKVQQNKNMRFHVEENIYGYTSKPLPEKKIVFIVHGLSVMNIRSVPCLAVSEFFKDLISLYFDHLPEFDIFLIPMANPDGVAQKKSYWNKNKSPQMTCPGVALDRNFNISWNTRRNMSSCSQQYPGRDAFSEPETRAVRSVFQRYGHRIAAFLNLHAGSSSAKILKGNAILYPKGYELQSLDQQYGHLKSEVLKALHLYTGGARDPHIVVDTMNKWHGKVAGTSVDYAAMVYRTPVSLELVMRPYKQNKPPLMDEAFTDIWTPALAAIFGFIEKISNKNK